MQNYRKLCKLMRFISASADEAEFDTKRRGGGRIKEDKR